jgi:hypothetical protein
MSGPISPKQAKVAHESDIPDVVFDVFNTFLTSYSGGRTSVVISQKAVVEALIAKGLERDKIFAKRWLDIEPYYRKKGWAVVYDLPGYNETYDPSWEFSVASGR